MVAVTTSAVVIAGAAGISVAFAALTFSGSSITGDSSFNSIVGATSTTWDVGAGNTLSLQTTNNGLITTGSGVFTVGGILSATNIDRAGTISIGTSSATGITIGRSGTAIVFGGNASTTGTLTITNATAGALTVTGGGSSMLGPVAISGGTLIIKHLSATSSITFGVIASTTCAVATIPVTNSAPGDTVVATPLPVASGIDTASTTWSGWVSAAGTVSVRACNPTSANSVSIAAQTWRADVWQH